MSINSDNDRKITHLIAEVAESSLMKCSCSVESAPSPRRGNPKHPKVHLQYTHAKNDSNNTIDIWSRVHNNLLTDGIGLVGIDVPQTHCHRTAIGCSPVNACSCIAICGYIKLEPVLT